MTDEAARELAAAINNLAEAINSLPRDLMGLRVNHTGAAPSALTPGQLQYIYSGGRFGVTLG